MEPLIIAEFQLQKFKLISRNIRRALLVEYPERLPGHNRFLDTTAKAMGYQSYYHLSRLAQTQFESDTGVHHAVRERRKELVHIIMELLDTQEAGDKIKVVEAIDSILDKYGNHEQSWAEQIQQPHGSERRAIPNEPLSPTKKQGCTRVWRRRRAIREKVSSGEFGTREVDVGLKAVLHICAKWGLGEQETTTLIFGSPASKSEPDSQTRLLEKLSYVLRIYRLLNDVQQGEMERAGSWIQRPMPVFDGASPIQLMKKDSAGCAEVMEYLEHVLQGRS